MFKNLENELGKLVLYKPISEKVRVIKTERPVTPIRDEVTRPAGSLDELHTLLKRRILSTRTWALSFLSSDEQEELAAILFSEVTRIWPEMKSFGHVALLNDEQNAKLLRRLTIYVVTTCQMLLDKYIEVFQDMLKTGTFENTSNFVRLKLMLAEEASRLLDIDTVRRYIIEDIRTFDSGGEDIQQPKTDNLTFSELVTLCRPMSEQRTKFSFEADLKMLKTKLPHMDVSVLRSVLSSLPPLPPVTLIENQNMREIEKHVDAVDYQSNLELLDQKSNEYSYPAFDSQRTRRIVSAENSLKYYEPEFTVHKPNTTFITEPIELDMKTKKEIIKSLQHIKIEDDPEVEIQPLLKTSLYLEGPTRRTAAKEERIASLQKLIGNLENSRRVEVKRSPYIQPDFFEVPVSKTIVMRASGPRVTERQLEARISLQPFFPYYDELSFDITEKDIDEMDEGLFVHRELQDVYKEIVAVIPKDYLEVSNEKSVLPAASGQFDLTRCMASSRLRQTSRRQSATISRLPPSTFLPLVNPDPPWQKEGYKNWVRSGPAKILSTTERNKIKASQPSVLAGIGQNLVAYLPDFMDPKVFMQWYSGWKQTVNSEDYWKYVNRQDTDFLAFMYHLWGNEADRGEFVNRLDSSAHMSSGHVSPMSQLSPRKRELSQTFSIGLSSGAATPAPGLSLGDDLWVQDSAYRYPLQTEAVIEEEKVKNEKKVKERARIFSKTGATQGILLEDYAAQRLENKREEEIKTRKLTPDEVLEKELSTMTIHERFARVWNFLGTSDENRTEILFKYSSSDTTRLLFVVKLWENVTHAILKREYILGQFEQFERIASDPNRYYAKGYLGSTRARLDEEVVRKSLSKQLDQHEIKVKSEIARLISATNDVVFYRGHNYLEKMKGDRVQILFWLSQERKAEALRQHLADLKINQAIMNSQLIGTEARYLLQRKIPHPPSHSNMPLPLTVEDILSQI